MQGGARAWVNGERVITNLLYALQPVLVAGAQACAKEKTEEAVKKAKARRGEETIEPGSDGK